MDWIKKIMGRHRLANTTELPGFAGGFVGFLGYENIQFFEKVHQRAKSGLPLEDGVFFLIKNFLVFDHFRRSISLIMLCNVENKAESYLKKKYRESLKRLTLLKEKLRRVLPREKENIKIGANSKFVANITKNDFENKIGRIKEYIRSGDCIQVVFSQRFALGKVEDDFLIYRALRSINPSPYMFYFRYGALRLIGSSPELLVKKTGRIVEIRPIAGTRMRGKEEQDDIRLEESLKHSKKEMAEHLMLVDLGRNDLGRVCDFKTIRVNDFARVERYSHVMHLVSRVSGRLRAGKDAFDLLRASFPAGTVTGAPKIRAMEIVDELEPEKRGPYAGSLGYFSFNGDMDMCITIRTIVVTNGRAYVQAGAGVVYDSQPKREYQETINKAKALMQAVYGARNR